MAHFFTFKNPLGETISLTQEMLKTAIEAKNSYSFEKSLDDNYPKELKCKESGLEAIQVSEKDPIVFTDNSILSMCMKEFVIKRILE